MRKKISDKDREDWENFISNKEKISNKDLAPPKKIRQEKVKKIDLHGYTLEKANRAIDDFIIKSFDESVTKIIVITGKGLRSKNVENPEYFIWSNDFKHFDNIAAKINLENYELINTNDPINDFYLFKKKNDTKTKI